MVPLWVMKKSCESCVENYSDIANMKAFCAWDHNQKLPSPILSNRLWPLCSSVIRTCFVTHAQHPHLWCWMASCQVNLVVLAGFYHDSRFNSSWLTWGGCYFGRPTNNIKVLLMLFIIDLKCGGKSWMGESGISFFLLLSVSPIRIAFSVKLAASLLFKNIKLIDS